ncbi:MAG: cytochrome P450, partial [Gammaproteobacteria bacterium]
MAQAEIPRYEDYIHEPNNTDFSSIPGDGGLPVLGHSIEIYKDPYTWAVKRVKQYGPISRMKMLGGEGVLAVGPDVNQRILLDPNKEFSSKMGFMGRLTIFFSGSLIMEDYNVHKHQRRIVQTAFKNEALKHYTSEINKIYERALDEWDADAGSEILFFNYIKNLLLEVAAEIFIGETERG